ncbi:MAG: hypothetical protein LQ340_003176, partial [Diploschistes diacapsis]
MTDPQHAKLKWTAQFKVTPPERCPTSLHGDKILLPTTVLEELLSAATVTMISEDQAPTSPNPSNPLVYANYADRARVIDRHQNLPHPLIFRLINPSNGNVVYAGVREFTAKEEEITISGFLRQILGLNRHEEEEKLTVHVEELAKGTYTRLRPLEAGYDADWKPLLERYLRNTFTTLTKGEIISVPSGSEEYRFLVDMFKPDADAICVVDTDLEVDIEALDEEQARETLKKKLQFKGDNSESGELEPGKTVIGSISQGEYVDYTLKDWDRSKVLELELISSEDLDLFVSPLTSRQRNRPRLDEHVFADVQGNSKAVKLQPTNAELDGAEELYVSVHYWKSSRVAGSEPSPFELKVFSETKEQGSTNELIGLDQDDAQCHNCGSCVPKRSMVLHENFCYRNNVRCSHCKLIFQKSSQEWKNHWHCPQDDAYGDSTYSHDKHDHLFHVLATCTLCGYHAKSVTKLAQHRTSTCPAKTILCQFCHLLVPQQGPDDLDPNDAEVILSGLTPHELSDGSRTTECHMCSKIIRLRDMGVHLRHHNLERLARITPRLCRNINCGRTLDGVGSRGEIKRQRQDNDLGLCGVCFGPLYNSAYDPDNKALRRRVERRYLTQFLTGCGNDYCRNEFCKTARQYLGLMQMSSKEAMQVVKPDLEGIASGSPLRFCADEQSQKRRLIANMLASELNEKGYDLPWTVAALEAEGGDLRNARTWLRNWAPT